MEVSPKVSAAEQALAWQQSRRRKDGHFDYPLSGLADGSYTLWLPANRRSEQLKIVEGKARRVVVEAVDDAEIATLQNEVLQSLVADASRQVIEADMRFIDLFVALLSRNYTLNDEDLSFLLAGNRWRENAIIYLLGGEQAVQRLAEIATSQLMPSQMPPEMPTPEFEPDDFTSPLPWQPAQAAAPAKRRWWRLWR